MGSRAYRVLVATFEGRRGRIFSRAGALTEAEAEALLAEGMRSSAAEPRLDLLNRGLTASPTAVFATHRTLGAPDVIQAFLRMTVDGAPAKVFACTVASQQRLEGDLAASPFVVETLSVQFASTADLTNPSLEAALQAWCERVMPGRPVPRIVLDPYAAELSQPDPLMLELLLRRSSDALTFAAAHPSAVLDQPRGFDPPPTLTDNSMQETAA